MPSNNLKFPFIFDLLKREGLFTGEFTTERVFNDMWVAHLANADFLPKETKKYYDDLSRRANASSRSEIPLGFDLSYMRGNQSIFTFYVDDERDRKNYIRLVKNRLDFVHWTKPDVRIHITLPRLNCMEDFQVGWNFLAYLRCLNVVETMSEKQDLEHIFFRTFGAGVFNTTAEKPIVCRTEEELIAAIEVIKETQNKIMWFYHTAAEKIFSLFKLYYKTRFDIITAFHTRMIATPEISRYENELKLFVKSCISFDPILGIISAVNPQVSTGEEAFYYIKQRSNQFMDYRRNYNVAKFLLPKEKFEIEQIVKGYVTAIFNAYVTMNKLVDIKMAADQFA